MRATQKLIAAAALGLFALSGQAEARAKEAYLCKMSYVSRDNFIPPEMAFWVDAKGAVTVLDAFIKHYAGKPVTAEIMQDTSKRLQFRWKLDKVDALQEGSNVGATKMPPIAYTAILRKATSMITVRVDLVGFINTPNAKGTCAPIKK